jgi:hypothetical protein
VSARLHRVHESVGRTVQGPFHPVTTDHVEFAAVESARYATAIVVFDLDMPPVIGDDTTDPSMRRIAGGVVGRHEA